MLAVVRRPASSRCTPGGHEAGHPEAIAAGAVKPFHHQQAFIRLAIDEIRGSLSGHNPLPPGAVRV